MARGRLVRPGPRGPATEQESRTRRPLRCGNSPLCPQGGALAPRFPAPALIHISGSRIRRTACARNLPRVPCYSRIPLVCFGGLERGPVSSRHSGRPPWVRRAPGPTPPGGFPGRLRLCSSVSSRRPPRFSPPEKSTTGHAAVNDGRAWGLRRGETTGQG